MANQPKHNTKPLSVRLDEQMVADIKGKAKAEGRNLTEVATDVWQGYLDGEAVVYEQVPAMPSTDGLATSEQLEDVRTALVQLAQGQAGIREDLIAQREDNRHAREAIARLLEERPQAIIPELPAPDMSGVEARIDKLVSEVKEMKQSAIRIPGRSYAPDVADELLRLLQHQSTNQDALYHAMVLMAERQEASLNALTALAEEVRAQAKPVKAKEFPERKQAVKRKSKARITSDKTLRDRLGDELYERVYGQGSAPARIVVR